MPIAPDIFVEISLMLLITIIISALFSLMRQPLIIGYILAGIIVGPLVLNVVKSADTMATFAQMGVVLLLFMVGLNLNPRIIKDVGKTSVLTGLGQVIFTSVCGFLISRALGFEPLTALYIAIAVSFSSTIIILKLLSDKQDMESLYGRISIGFLIVQDIIAIIALLVMSTLTEDGFSPIAASTIGLGILGLIIIFIIGIYVFPRLLRLVARSQEFLLLFSLAWCFIVSTFFFTLNLSVEAGALLAGISLSMTPYHLEIGSRMRPLRDFFLVLFFILLGTQMVFNNVTQFIIPIIIFSLLILVGNPLIVMTLMGLLKYTKRNSFLAGLTVAQISEFSLILITFGVSSGHLDGDILSLMTVIGLITMGGSTYMILYADKLYRVVSPLLSLFERRGKKVDEHRYSHQKKYDIILFGHNRLGFDILESLRKIKKKFLVVDFDPDAVIKLSREGYDCRYGDANDSELLDDLNFSQAKMIISTVPSIDTNLLLVRKVREVNKKAIVAVVSFQIDNALQLYEEGASYVILPHLLGGNHVSTMIESHGLSASKFLKEKVEHIEHLKQRKNTSHGSIVVHTK